MEDQDVLDGPIVPIHLTLPVAAMSLHEIDAAKPGTLVDTGVRLEEVEVGLWSAGYRFATGRLVVIGEHLGVEIARTERDLP
jgi:flagellar motor switch/type III secretory pathway protein FliN